MINVKQWLHNEIFFVLIDLGQHMNKGFIFNKYYTNFLGVHANVCA